MASLFYIFKELYLAANLEVLLLECVLRDREEF